MHLRGLFTPQNSKLQINSKDAEKFLQMLDPLADTFDFRTIFPKERKHDPRKPSPLTSNRRGSWKGVKGWVWSRSQDLCGSYVVVNKSDGIGTCKDNITLIRAIYADWDGIEDEPASIPANLPIQPSFITETSPGSYQGFWLVGAEEGTTDRLTIDQFDDVISAIHFEYGGDPGCEGSQRVMRIPGTWWTKCDPVFQVRFHQAPDNADDVIWYTPVQIMEAFRPAIARMKQHQQLSKIATRTGAYRSTADSWDEEKVREALEFIDPDDSFQDDAPYLAWVKIVWAIANGSGLSHEGYELAKEWSKRSQDFDEEELDAKFYDRSQGGSVTLGTLFFRAMEEGYEFPSRTVLIEHEDEDGLVEQAHVWPDLIKRSDKMVPDPTSRDNIVAFLGSRKIRPWFNEFDRKIYVNFSDGSTKQLDDALLNELRMSMYSECRVGKELHVDVISWMAHKMRSHPVRSYLESLEWDGEERISGWLQDYLGAEEGDYVEFIGSRFLVAAVRRIYEPGYKFDSMLVLEGLQGAGKSSALRVLAGDDWFADATEVGADPKEIIETTSGAWIVECAELSGLSKREVEKVKTFVSRQNDKARGAYNRFVDDVPRQFVLAGTVNKERYLLDDTGNRRFWPIRVGVEREVDLNALAQDRDQLWAEAYYFAMKPKFKTYMSGEILELSRTEQNARRYVDDVEEQLHDWFALYAIEDELSFVLKNDVFEALGSGDVNSRKGIGRKVNDAMSAVGWKETRQRVAGFPTPQRMFISSEWGDSLQRLIYEEGTNSFVFK